MKEPKWLLLETVVAVHQVLIADHGGLPGIRDLALLESALSRPRQQVAYGDDYGLPELAAAYCYGLARNHPFVDGNKRVALTIAGVFLAMNGFEFDASEAEAVVMIEQLASGKIEEADLAAWFADNVIENKS